MIVFLLGLVDLAGAVLTLLTIVKAQFGGTSLFFASLLILKALYSLLSSLGSSGKSYLAAAEDLFAAIFIILSVMGIYLHYTLVGIVGVLLLIKSMQSILPETLG